MNCGVGRGDMMSRLIDADALRAQMYHEAFETDTDMQRWDSGCWIRYKMFENALDNAPTIEPQRKRGEWIDVDDYYNRISGKCSVCGWESHMYEDDVVGMDYCPHCGADMRGEQE